MPWAIARPSARVPSWSAAAPSPRQGIKTASASAAALYCFAEFIIGPDPLARNDKFSERNAVWLEYVSGFETEVVDALVVRAIDAKGRISI